MLSGLTGRREAVSAFAYVSVARPGLTAEDVQQLVEVSSERNRTCGITGILIFNGRNFFQIVEGPHEPLYALLDRLNRDPRHARLSLVYEEVGQPRLFMDWGLRAWQGADLVLVPKDLPPGLDPRLRAMSHAFAAML